MPAVRIQTRSVPNAAVIHAARTAVQKLSKFAPGTTASAIVITRAWPKIVASPTAIHPIRALRLTRTGRTIMPTSPVTAAATTSGNHDVYVNPGSSSAVSRSARNVRNHDASSLTTSAVRGVRRFHEGACGSLFRSSRVSMSGHHRLVPSIDGRNSLTGARQQLAQDRRDSGILVRPLDVHDERTPVLRRGP